MTARSDVPLPFPLYDAQGPGWVVTRSQTSVVGVSAGRLEFFSHSAVPGVCMILETSEASRLTYPLFQLMSSLGAVWLCRGRDGALRDARSGAAIDSYHSVAQVALGLRPVSEASAALPLDGFDVDQGRTVSEGRTVAEAGTVEIRRAGDDVAWLQFAVSVHHGAGIETVVGRTLETLVDSFAADSPILWSSAEPVTIPWDSSAVTGLARGRMPNDTRIFAASGGEGRFRATIRVARSETGVTEETRALFAVEDFVGSDSAAVENAFRSLATNQRVLMGSAWSLRGAPDTTIAAFSQQMPQPIAAVIGARAVRDLDLARTAIPDSFLVGNARIPSMVVNFGGDDTGWKRFAAAVNSIGLDRFEQVLVPEVLRRAT